MLPFFPVIEFSVTELVQLKEKFSDPLVKKYLTYLAAVESSDLVENGEPKDGETAESFLRRQATVRGKVEAMVTLLALSQVEEPAQGNNGNIAG